MRFKTRTVRVPENIQTFPPPPQSTAKKPRMATSKIHKTRTFVLPTLVVLVFVTLVLGVIYAYCVSKPHSELGATTLEPFTNNTASASIGSLTEPTNAADNDDGAYLDSSYFPRRAEDNNSPDPESATVSPQATVNGSLSRQLTAGGDEDRSALPQASLFFYTGTVPFISLLDLSTQLFFHCHHPSFLGSQKAHRVLLISTVVLVTGWIVSNSFWIHCELVPSGTANRRVDQGGICPAQVRGHFMYGIHELSIAKVVIAWIIVILYIVYAGMLVVNMRASRRVWVILGGDAPDRKHGRKEEVVFRLEDGIRAQREKEEQWATQPRY